MPRSSTASPVPGFRVVPDMEEDLSDIWASVRVSSGLEASASHIEDTRSGHLETDASSPDAADRANRAVNFTEGPKFLNAQPDKSENAEIWRTYVEEANKHDTALLKKWGDGIDIFLLFTGLFSAILSAFLVVSWSALQPDPTQSTSDALATISQQLVLMSSNSRMNQSAAYQVPNFSPPPWAVTVNCLWFTALFISLLTAVLAMLLKEWLSAYTDGVALVPLERVKQRQMRYDGLDKWRVPAIVSFLPLAIHIAVFLFLTGLVLFAWSVSVVLSTLMTILLLIGFGLYTVSAVLPLILPECPYKSPFAYVIEVPGRMLADLLFKIRALLCWTGSQGRKTGLFHLHSKYAPRMPRMVDREVEFLAENSMLLQAKAIAWMTTSSNPTVQELAVYFVSWWRTTVFVKNEIDLEFQRAALRIVSEAALSTRREGTPNGFGNSFQMGGRTVIEPCLVN
ncbi:hypothetical protein CALVIDRAFT_596320 [Calocera viscosa TUFC12733]|uniref:DUF6535 domain-containing protein n=1 Tax=Calocera viscosa (strain TUFC12733) TaxID=1330018 RepID=A0A167PXT8_CALVF|nr:hypothetical protein CALVIDRAFT_596320 [Calocera viscosa TUFC12733]